MEQPNGARGSRRPGCLAITAIMLSCVAWLHVGCANDPYSQTRIELRRAHIQQTIQGIADHEGGAAARLQQQVQAFRQWYEEDEVMFRERMRTAGNNVW